MFADPDIQCLKTNTEGAEETRSKHRDRQARIALISSLRSYVIVEVLRGWCIGISLGISVLCAFKPRQRVLKKVHKESRENRVNGLHAAIDPLEAT